MKCGWLVHASAVVLLAVSMVNMNVSQQDDVINPSAKLKVIFTKDQDSSDEVDSMSITKEQAMHFGLFRDILEDSGIETIHEYGFSVPMTHGNPASLSILIALTEREVGLVQRYLEELQLSLDELIQLWKFANYLDLRDSYDDDEIETSQNNKLQLLLGYLAEKIKKIDDGQAQIESMKAIFKEIDEHVDLKNELIKQLMPAVCVHTLSGHEDVVKSAQWGPDGNSIVTELSNGIARVWNVQTGECVQTLRGNEGNVERAQRSPDGKFIVITSDYDVMARIWNVQTGVWMKPL